MWDESITKQFSFAIVETFKFFIIILNKLYNQGTVILEFNARFACIRLGERSIWRRDASLKKITTASDKLTLLKCC